MNGLINRDGKFGTTNIIVSATDQNRLASRAGEEGTEVPRFRPAAEAFPICDTPLGVFEEET